jgi:hypothetical protein
MGPKIAPRIEAKIHQKLVRDTSLNATDEQNVNAICERDQIFDINSQESDTQSIPIELSEIASEEDIPKVFNDIHYHSRPTHLMQSKVINTSN